MSRTLSDRVRASVEAAPWVCDEIRTLEQKLSGALIERDMARAQRDALTDSLTRIHALIQPPHVVLPDGRRMQFVPPLDLLAETWGALSKAIREIPDTLRATHEKEPKP